MAGFFLAERPPFRWISAIAGQGGTMAAQIDAVTEFQNTFKLLFQKRNWMVALPVVIGGVIAGIIGGIGFFVAFGSLIGAGGLAGAMSGEGRGGGGLAAMLLSGAGLIFLVVLVIAIIVGAFAAIWTYSAAEPVWSGGDPDLGGGFSKATGRLGAVIVLGLIAAVIVALSWTIIVPLAAAVFFLVWGLYIVPIIVKDNQSAFGAISASMKLSRENMNPTLMLLLGLIVIGVATGIVNAILGIIPLIGALVGLAVSALAQGFSSLAVWRFYNILTGAAAPAAAAAPPPPTTPTT
jgi:hypothetical protein